MFLPLFTCFLSLLSYLLFINYYKKDDSIFDQYILPDHNNSHERMHIDDMHLNGTIVPASEKTKLLPTVLNINSIGLYQSLHNTHTNDPLTTQNENQSILHHQKLTNLHARLSPTTFCIKSIINPTFIKDPSNHGSNSSKSTSDLVSSLSLLSPPLQSSALVAEKGKTTNEIEEKDVLISQTYPSLDDPEKGLLPAISPHTKDIHDTDSITQVAYS